jgi:molybdenum cofactor biosynthesis enzyme
MADRAVIFKFEELGEDLARAPLAAQRLFRWTGMHLKARGWEAIGPELRRAIAVEGSKEIISTSLAQGIFRELPMREVEMHPPYAEYESEPRPELTQALALSLPLTREQWSAFPGVARFALNALSNNARLLWRAMGEIRPMARAPVAIGRSPFRGLVASCDLALDKALPSFEPLMKLLVANKMFDGKGFVLARAAGLRAARRTQETLDMQSETAVGPIELDWLVEPSRGAVLWQAHASSWGGEFYPAASLIAVTTAATALLDMMYEVQRSASLRAAHIAEDAWRVGRVDDDDDDGGATQMFSAAMFPSNGRKG